MYLIIEHYIACEQAHLDGEPQPRAGKKNGARKSFLGLILLASFGTQTSEPARRLSTKLRGTFPIFLFTTENLF